MKRIKDDGARKETKDAALHVTFLSLAVRFDSRVGRERERALRDLLSTANELLASVNP